MKDIRIKISNIESKTKCDWTTPEILSLIPMISKFDVISANVFGNMRLTCKAWFQMLSLEKIKEIRITNFDPTDPKNNEDFSTKFKDLTHLDFKPFSKFVDCFTCSLIFNNPKFERLAKLEKLDLNYRVDLSNDDFLDFSKIKNLKVLKLKYAINLSHATLYEISNFRELQKLQLCFTMADDQLLFHVSKLKCMQYLDLQHCRSITEWGIWHLTSLTDLKYLNLSHNGVLGSDIMHALSNIPSLEELNLSHNEYLGVELFHLKNLTKLKKLDLREIYGQKKFSSHTLWISELYNLAALGIGSFYAHESKEKRTFNYYNYEYIGDDDDENSVVDNSEFFFTLKNLLHLKKLETLQLHNVLEMESLSELTVLSKLTELYLSNTIVINQLWISLNSLTMLQKLVFDTVSIKRVNFLKNDTFDNLKSLKTIKFCKISDFVEENLLWCSGLTNLTKLVVSDCGIKLKFNYLDKLKTLKKLIILKLSVDRINTGLDNSTVNPLKHLSNFKYLKTLDISSWPNINDETIKYITLITSLTSLDVSYCDQANLTSSGFYSLLPMKNLKIIKVSRLMNMNAVVRRQRSAFKKWEIFEKPFEKI